ncbi:hypothetical protein DCO57_23160 [Labrenzia sp. 011]|nr:hypothetical protein DCO57_23160 [Labrenzia sp. 011]
MSDDCASTISVDVTWLGIGKTIRLYTMEIFSAGKEGGRRLEPSTMCRDRGRPAIVRGLSRCLSKKRTGMVLGERDTMPVVSRNVGRF